METNRSNKMIIKPWPNCNPRKGTPGEFVIFHSTDTIDSAYWKRPGAWLSTTVNIGQRNSTGRLRKVGDTRCSLVIFGTGWEWQKPAIEELMRRLNSPEEPIELPKSIVGLRAWVKLERLLGLRSSLGGEVKPVDF
jgi:hypothetical protein